MDATAALTTTAPDDDAALVAALRRGDEQAFAAVVDRYGPLMLRLARQHVSSRAIAEEVVQDAWCAVLTGIGRFEARSSFKTWLLRILVNRAMRRGQREARTMPFSALAGAAGEAPAVTPDRLLAGAGDGRAAPWPGGGASLRPVPDACLLDREAADHVRAAIRTLPGRQREVVVLRDVAGLSADEVCDAMRLSDGNQRVLLHRGRAQVRAALRPYLAGEPAAA
jgi:RNA polymerase sigma-70 factor (ECF subfamily)